MPWGLRWSASHSTLLHGGAIGQLLPLGEGVALYVVEALHKLTQLAPNKHAKHAYRKLMDTLSFVLVRENANIHLTFMQRSKSRKPSAAASQGQALNASH
jgi:hypothetical protein